MTVASISEKSTPERFYISEVTRAVRMRKV